ncbi:ATP-dependent DNA helicase Q5-like isoform X1 [Salmo trutta]|uniref:ATP-dependent DNA helicase Q5-like isoform X1 n=1 Tax=Salmo trutta TaxID=8032 RepID=UPI0011314B67|nr:ATP-dependent DNA helicase Q5-like isoform X1 [Salmo trutta]
MVAFCEQEGCRHATISKFFGDQKPDCAGACDYCRDPKAVQAQLEKGATLCTKTGAARSTQPRGPFGFDRDLYAGGRKGYGFERHDEEGWESGDDDDGSEHWRKEFGDLFKKQMNLRKMISAHSGRPAGRTFPGSLSRYSSTMETSHTRMLTCMLTLWSTVWPCYRRL